MDDTKKDKLRYHKCYHNPKGVKCELPTTKCTKCGWNPEIEIIRKEKMRMRNAN